MKKTFTYGLVAFLCGIIILCACPFSAAAQNEDYIIKNYDVDITVNKDRTYTVVETLDVFFNNECHGIIRDIPTYASQEREVRIEKVSVEGAAFEYDGYGTIKIGDADKTVKGDMRYIIKYTLWQYADEADDFDFAYINVLGTQWDTYTEKFTSCIHLPEDFVLERYSLTDGGYSSETNELSSISFGENNEIFISSNGQMEPYEGITIKMFFPEGSFSEAEKYVPNLVFNRVEVNGKMDENGRSDITVNYNVTVNKGCSIWLDFTDRDEFTRSKSESCKIVYPYRTVEEDNSNYAYISLYDYEGETIDVKLNFVKQYYVRGGVQDAEYAQLVYEGDYSSYGGELVIHYEFPFDVDAAELRNRIDSYYGEDNVYRNAQISVNKNIVDITCELQSEEDYFIYASMPNATFVHYKSFTDAFIPALASLIVLVIIYFVFMSPRYTHKPVPTMYPPEGMTPAEMGYILNSKFEKKYISAMVIYWASKGYIKIRKEGRDFVLIKTGTPLKAKAFESKLFTFFWQDSNEFRTSEDHYDEGDYIKEASKKLKKSIEGKKSMIDKKSKFLSVVFGLVLPIVSLLIANITVIVRFDSASSSVAFLNILFNFTVLFLLYFRGRALERTMHERGRWFGRSFSIVYALVLSVLTSYCFEIAARDLICAKGIGFIFAFICCAASFFASFMKRRTPQIKETLTQIVGYRKFLENIPIDKMQVLLSMDKNAYYNVLPYAMVLGLAKTVTKSFAELDNSIGSPDWYEGDIYYDGMYNYFDYRVFDELDGRIKTSVQPSAYESSDDGGGFSSGGGFSGSDFSSGGSSGGGSGGGGGTSW